VHPVRPASCCQPSRAGGERSGAAAPVAVAARTGPAPDGFVALPGGEFTMGGEDRDAVPGDGEGPQRRVRVPPFAIAACAAFNDEFARFADDTGYVTEAEWEYAARGGLDGARYAWGDELTPGGEHRCNIWQGRFPIGNTAEDGHAGTAPVAAFPANGFGLHDVAGNVWEWCADWWSAEHGTRSLHDPRGPRHGSAKVMRGGSYLCHESYCNRYRVAARTSNSPDSSTGNQGFRCARDA
jgi:formylglycine-generating enzyme required for sulfatase activity